MSEQDVTDELAAYIAEERQFLGANPHAKRTTVEYENGMVLRVSRTKVHVKGVDDKKWINASADFPPSPSDQSAQEGER